MASTYKRQREKLHFIALAVAVTSPTKQQTEGAYRVMHLKRPSMEIIPIEHRWDALSTCTKQFIEHNW